MEKLRWRVEVGGELVSRDVSKNNLTRQLKRLEISLLRSAFLLVEKDPSPMTFFRNECKIVAPFFVNSFAKLYFFPKYSFHLPLPARVITLHFPPSKRGES
jgi:hypothetical protein